jgi:transposase
MRLRYRYRLDPDPAQRRALAKAFGYARVVFNDGLRAREDAYKAGRPYLSDGELSRRLTVAKGTPERAWLGEVSAVVLQQSLADLHRAYRNYFRAVTEAKAARARGEKARLKVRKPGSSRGTTIRRCGSRPTAASGFYPTAGCRSRRSAT